MTSLTPKQMAELRAISSRANIAATSFVNEYQWGDLKGEPVDWMWRYFDAHVYVANWCTCVLSLRLPTKAFKAGVFRDFTTETTFSARQTRTYWLLEWVLEESENYERFALEDGRGWMGRLAPLRDELLRGDMRPLYLGWLAGVNAGEVSDRTTEPEPPPGLSRLSAAQQSLADFLEKDEDLLSAAGLVDPPDFRPGSEGDTELDAWVSTLPVAEKNAILKLLLTGKSRQAERKLKQQFLALRRGQPTSAKPATPGRNVADLHKLEASAAEARKKQAAILRKKLQAEQQAERENYLRTLAADFHKCWRTADKCAERGIASAYDEVKRLLVDLSDAYTLCATRADFDRRHGKFIARHEKRGALVRRIVEVSLWQKTSR